MSAVQQGTAPAVAAARTRPWLPIAVVALSAGILAAFVGLLPMAAWRVDEFHDFGLYRTRGWSYFFERLATWSPRPLSEPLAGLYFLVEEATRSQLVAPFLAVMAAPLLIGPALYVGRARGGDQRVTRLLIAAVVPPLFLLGHPVSEVFYWPMGAVAYATTLAAVTMLGFQLLDGRWAQGHGRLLCIVCALCAAGLTEFGAIFAIFFALCMTLLHWSERIGTRREGRPWLLPLLLGIVVMIFLALGRGRLAEHVVFHGVASNPTYDHHPIASFLRSFPTYFRELVVLDGVQNSASAFAWGAIVKALICFGLLAALWSERGAALKPGSRWVQGALLLSLQATFFVSIAGSYYKFGLVCCERHDTIRQCLVVLTALVGMALLARALPVLARPARMRTAGAGLLGAALLILLARELPALKGAYAAWPTAVRVRHANWDSGHAPGPRMTRMMVPQPPVVDGMVAPEAGVYRQGSDPPWLWELVMTFFGKQEIELKPVLSPR